MKRIVISLLIATGAFAAEPAAPDAAPAPPQGPLTLAAVVSLSASTVQVRIAGLDQAIAKAGLGAERMALMPQLSATGGLTRTSPWQPVNGDTVKISPYNVWDARLRLGQAILDLEAWNRSKAAGRRLSAAEAAATLALEGAAANASGAYVGLAAAQALAEVRRKDLQLAQDLLTQAKAQVDAGATESIAATRAASRVEAARSASVSADGGVRSATIALARTLDLDPSAVLVAGQALDDALVTTSAPLDPAAAVSAARSTRPELRVSAETLSALEADRLAAQGARLPKVSGFADAGRTGVATDDMTTTWEIGVAVTIPLIDRSYYDQEAAELRVQRERLRANDLDQRIRAEVRDALVQLETARARLAADLDASRLATQEVSEARARFDAGAAGNLELINAQQSLTSAEEAVVGSRQAAAQARVRLAQAVGSATTLR